MSTFTGMATLARDDPQPLATFQCVACDRRQDAERPVMPRDPDSRPFDLLRCTGCGLIQQYPRYTADQIAALYDGDYYVFAEEDASRWARAVQQYAVHLKRWERPGFRRLLDVGCALGHLSAIAQRRGWRVVGIDVSALAVSRAADRFGHDFRAGTLSRHRDTLPPFDVVFLGDVIEHVPHPGRLLTEVRRLLAPDGLVCIDTPNWASRWRRWGRRHWVGLNRFHINLFDADSLTRLLAASGFGPVQTAGYTHYLYESWANRPEPQALIRKLPDALAWRINRFLTARARHKPWAPLREQPPATLDAALTTLDQLPPTPDRHRRPTTSADNLIATAPRLA